MISRHTQLALAFALSLGASSIASAQAGTPAQAGQAAEPTLTAAERAKYVSNWDLSTPEGEKLVVKIYSAGDKLYAMAEGKADTLTLKYLGNDSFVGVVGPPFHLTLYFDNGKPTRMKVEDPEGHVMDAVARVQ